MIGKIQRVPLRDIWKHEALDFTTWLQDNMDVLSDCLDFSLNNAERERSAGAFNVHSVAEDEFLAIPSSSRTNWRRAITTTSERSSHI